MWSTVPQRSAWAASHDHAPCELHAGCRELGARELIRAKAPCDPTLLACSSVACVTAVIPVWPPSMRGWLYKKTLWHSPVNGIQGSIRVASIKPPRHASIAYRFWPAINSACAGNEFEIICSCIRADIEEPMLPGHLYTLPRTHLLRPSSVERSRTPNMQCPTQRSSINPFQNRSRSSVQYTVVLHRNLQ